MQHDTVIWNSVHHHFCSYKVKTARQTFCRNKYNITGLCERTSCPLANSRYATIVENDDRLYLFIKTVERAHSPRRLWERIRLSQNYRHALLQIDRHLQHWPQFYVHKAKQRLTKMTQYLIRKRKLQLQANTRLVGAKKKVLRREASREKKAINAAKLETAIEHELLERLRTGAYGDIYNFAQDEYEKALDARVEEEMDEQEQQEEEEEEEAHQYEAEYDDSEDELVSDIEDVNEDHPQYDFDDSDLEQLEDDGEHSDEEHSDDEHSDEGKPIDTARSDQELKDFVKRKAQRRALEKRKRDDTTKGKKGRKLRRASDGVRVEVEYEREPHTEAQYR